MVQRLRAMMEVEVKVKVETLAAPPLRLPTFRTLTPHAIRLSTFRTKLCVRRPVCLLLRLSQQDYIWDTGKGITHNQAPSSYHVRP